jgi:hypothetical protein
MTNPFLFRMFILINVAFWGGFALPKQVPASDLQHMVASVKGSVRVKKAGRSKDVSAYIGMLIKDGDVVTLGKDSMAKVVCADRTLLNIDSSPYTVQCRANKAELKFKKSRVTRVRTGSFISDFPILISPRRTKLLSPHPKIRWTPVKSDSIYHVKVERGIQVVWEGDVSSATEITYPDNPQKARPLQPGVTYTVAITVGNRRSTEEKPGVNLGFTVLSQKEVKEVREAERKLRKLALPDEATRFLIANLYATWRLDVDNPGDAWALNAEAIQELESLPNTREPAILRMLGDLYQGLDLTFMAEDYYMKALTISEELKDKDLEGQALSQYALGKIFKVRFNKAEATRRLTLAKQLSESIGDLGFVQIIDQELAEIK